MKRVKEMLAVVALLVSVNVVADDDQIFFCTLHNGQQVLLEHNSMTDAFTFKYGKDINTPEITATRPSINLGTMVTVDEGTLAKHRFFMMMDERYFYKIESITDKGSDQGYLQIMNGGTELVYAKCKSDTLVTKFSDDALFVNLTEVD